MYLCRDVPTKYALFMLLIALCKMFCKLYLGYGGDISYIVMTLEKVDITFNIFV
jgi:hypothetical protein